MQTDQTIYTGDGINGDHLQTTTHYDYNLQGQMTKATVKVAVSGNLNTTSTSTYTYNPDGIRTGQSVIAGGSTTNTTYLIDSNNPTGYAQVLNEYVNGTLSKTYTLGLDVISQWDSTHGTLTFLYDGHGSTRALINTLAQVIQRFAYDAFGNSLTATNLTAQASALTTLLYSGEQTDAATGLQYLRARYYSERMGRFTSSDSYAGSSSDPLSLHKYLYAGANPITFSDPSGHDFTITGLLATTATIGTLSGFILGGIGGGWEGAKQGAERGFMYGLLGGAAILAGGVGLAYLGGASVSASLGGLVVSGGSISLIGGMQISGFLLGTVGISQAARLALTGITPSQRAAGWVGVGLGFAMLGFSAYQGEMVGVSRPIHYDVGGGADPTVLPGYQNINVDPAFGNGDDVQLIIRNQQFGVDQTINGTTENIPGPDGSGARITATSIPPSAIRAPGAATEFARVLGPRGQIVLGGRNIPSVVDAIRAFAQNMGLQSPPEPDANSDMYYVHYNYANLKTN